ncbi:MAG: STAS domain-containing protein [Pseudonocardiaceae bacterium]
MAAEAAPDVSIPSSESVGYIDNTGLLSVAVQQLKQATLVIYVAGELDMITGPPLQDHLGELLATGPDRLIIDLSQVSFMGSTGLSVLICTRQNAIETGTNLQLSGTSGRAVAVPLEITGLNHLFEILPTPPATGDEQP